MKTLVFLVSFITCSSFAFGATYQPTQKEKNWLLGKWVVIYDQQQLSKLKKYLGSRTVEWTEQEYIKQNQARKDHYTKKIYEIITITPETITFKCKQGTETWYKAAGGVCTINPTTKDVIQFLVKAK